MNAWYVVAMGVAAISAALLINSCNDSSNADLEKAMERRYIEACAAKGGVVFRIGGRVYSCHTLED